MTWGLMSTLGLVATVAREAALFSLGVLIGAVLADRDRS